MKHSTVMLRLLHLGRKKKAPAHGIDIGRCQFRPEPRQHVDRGVDKSR